MNEAQKPFLSFRVAEQLYALPISQVVEVAVMVEVERLPQTPDYLLGIANRHGQALPILSLSALFAGKQPTPRLNDLFIVVTPDESSESSSLIGLWVDEVQQVRYLDPDYFRPLSGASPYVQTIASDGEDLFQLVALGALLAVLNVPQEADER
jgi:purine-binding chemotaxis protein CheW